MASETQCRRSSRFFRVLLEPLTHNRRFLGHDHAFYPWLRQIAWERLVHLHDRHIRAQKRTVNREEAKEMYLSEDSAVQLADRLVASGTSPSRHLVRAEMRTRVRKALDRMLPHDREVLIMWHLEELSVSEIAVLLGLTEAGVKSRHRRALERMLPALDSNIENAWIGRTLAIGSEVRLSVTGPCPRCVMTTLPQGDLPKDPGILRTAAQHNQVHVGVYASVLRGGTIRRGDPVTVE